MPVSFQIHPERGVIVNVIRGKLTEDDLRRSYLELAGEQNYDPSFSVVTIFEANCDPSEIDISVLQRNAVNAEKVLRREERAEPSYQALFCASDTLEIFARFFSAANESRPEAHAKRKICTSIAEAEAWTGCRLAGIPEIERAVNQSGL